MPAEIVCDNEKQFVGSKVSKFLEDHKIKRIASTPYHLSGNGKAESTNKTIIQNLKKRLADAKGKWKEILSEVMWEYHTTLKSSTEATLFSLVYGVETMIPVEVGEPSFRFRCATEETNNETLNTSLELLDKRPRPYCSSEITDQEVLQPKNKPTKIQCRGLGIKEGYIEH
nr:uncharacterized protein LOC104119682 [Nicotiana tomentosiformis]